MTVVFGKGNFSLVCLIRYNNMVKKTLMCCRFPSDVHVNIYIYIYELIDKIHSINLCEESGSHTSQAPLAYPHLYIDE